MSITVKHVNKTFGSFQALTDVSVEVPSGELVALLGPSGSGKTTLLRIIGGLETADSGELYFAGEESSDQAARERNVGFVFQHYALFRHMTVFENVAFPLRIKKRPKEEVESRVHELLKLIQLEGIGRRYPSQLSGGQRQRVALARALAGKPRVMLLDEPFGALDARVRKDLRRWLRKLHQDIHVTSILVTHDQEEALEVADRVIIMNHGKIEQVGSPDEVYNHPANPFVISFLGTVNVFHGRSDDGSTQFAGTGLKEGKQAAYVRPHEIDLVRGNTGPKGAVGTVSWVHRAGAMVKVEVKVSGSEEVLVAELTREKYATLAVQPGEIVTVVARESRVFEGDFDI